MFNFRTRKAFNFLRLNKSDPLKILKLNNLFIFLPILILKLELTNTIPTTNTANTLSVNTYLVTIKSRANYIFFN